MDTDMSTLPVSPSEPVPGHMDELVCVCVCVCVWRERERERKRETDRQADRQRSRETYTPTYLHTPKCTQIKSYSRIGKI